MKTLSLIAFLLFCTGCSDTSIFSMPKQDIVFPQDIEADKMKPSTGLPDLGEAPEFQTDVWLNVDTPLRLADMKGKVVLVNMWTFGCINCRNVIPQLVDWDKKYSGEGLIVIGNHFPEFEREKDLQNLSKAVTDFGIKYPVTQDNEGLNWKAYKNKFWPTLYLIDKEGHIRYTHIGEGDYSSTEKAIRYLLDK